jgi:hypothetical protein
MTAQIETKRTQIETKITQIETNDIKSLEYIYNSKRNNEYFKKRRI